MTTKLKSKASTEKKTYNDTDVAKMLEEYTTHVLLSVHRNVDHISVSDYMKDRSLVNNIR